MRPRRRLFLAIRISAWSATVIAVLCAVLVLYFFYRGDSEGASRIANREIDFLLQRGESVQHRVPVMRRHWWDYFRTTHGVLAATNRRLLYVGVPPEELLSRESEPRELEENAWMYDALREAQRSRSLPGTRPVVALAATGTRDRFFVERRDAGRLDTILTVIRVRQAELLAMQEAERRAVEVSAAAARRPIYYLVQAGESLELIATRYGTTVDSLRVWNALTGDRIQAGQRLLVRAGR